MTGDFNHDGFPDVAVVSVGGIQVLLGKGDGSFQVPVTYPAGSTPRAIVVADFNKDGNLDLATADNSGNNVSVLLGAGDGTFQPARNYFVGTQPVDLAVGDFNGDGKPDLAVTNNNPQGPGTFSILFGVGDGTFHNVVNHDVGKTPINIAAGDFNGDGKPDLAIALAGGKLLLLMARGGGTFDPPVTVSAGPNPGGVAARDIDGDGLTDLVVTNNSSSNLGVYSVSVLKGKGDGTFQSPTPYAVAGNPQWIAFGDFDRNGTSDMAVACRSALTVLLNTGHGTYQRIANFAAGTAPSSVVAVDLNGDGKVDLAVTNQGSKNVSILLGNGDGTFRPQVTYPVGNAPLWVAAGDFNGDGKPDLAVSNLTDSTISILLGNGDGTFQPQVVTAVPQGAGRLAVAKFAAGAHLGLATVSPYGAEDISVLVGNGDGTFQIGTFELDANAELVTGSALATGDFNGDGKPDLAIQVAECEDEYCNGATLIYLGNGDGTFTESQSTYAGYVVPVVADFNADGNVDLAGGSLWQVWVALGNGNGGFQQYTPYTADLSFAAAADFNLDGKLDLVGAGPGVASIVPGNGDGRFQGRLCSSWGAVLTPSRRPI